MNLNLGSPSFPRLAIPSPILKFLDTSQFNLSSRKKNAFVFLLFATKRELSSSTYHHLSTFSAPRSSRKGEISLVEESLQDDSTVLDEGILNCVSAAKDACEALDIIAGSSTRRGGVVGNSDCCSIITAAFDRSNVDLALSIFLAMRSSFSTGRHVKDYRQGWPGCVGPALP